MKCENFVNSLLENLIPPKIEIGQNLYFEIHIQIATSISIFDGFQQMRAQNLSWIVYNLKIVIYH